MHSYKLTGRQARILSAYHQGIAAKARARYDEMKVLRAMGKTYLEIGVLYGITESSVWKIFKRYEGA